MPDPRTAWLDATFDAQSALDWSGLRVERLSEIVDVVADDLDGWIAVTTPADSNLRTVSRRRFLSRMLTVIRGARSDVLARARAILRSSLPVDAKRTFLRGMASRSDSPTVRSGIMALLQSPDAKTGGAT